MSDQKKEEIITRGENPVLITYYRITTVMDTWPVQPSSQLESV